MIYDVFPYRDESEVLEIRMEELSGVVDRHLLIQSSYTFTELRKPTVLGGEKLIARTLPDSLMLTTDDPWERESRTCEFAMDRAREMMRPGDYLLIGDVDEIVRAELISLATSISEPLAFDLDVYRCWLDHLAPDQQTWRPVLIPYEWVKRLNWATARKTHAHAMVAKKAGWHFTDMTSRHLDKLAATAHANEPPVLEAADAIRTGRETLYQRYMREGLLERVPLSRLPAYVQNNVPRMRELGLLQPELI